MASIHEHTLSNGMQLLCCPLPHLHSIEFGVYLRGGTLYENRQNQGICHLLEHLCFRCLGGMPGGDLTRALDRMGATLDGSTYPEGVVFRLRVLPRFFDDALTLLARLFSDIPWTEEAIREEKRVVLRQIEQEDADFDEEVARRYRRTAAGAFPLMGTKESVSALSPAVIRRWQRLLFQPQNACLCISGNFSAAMESTAAETFGELLNHSPEPPFSQPTPLGFCMRDSRSDYVAEEEGGQAKVRIAFDIDEDRVYPLVGEVLSAITGENNSSLLFQTLREEKALVAEIDSTIEEMGLFRRLIISYDVEQELLEESLTQVFQLLRRLTQYVRPVRLDQCRMLFTDNYLFDQDDAAAMNELMGWSCLAEDLARADLDAKAQMYEDLTCEDLLDAAQCVFRPENLCISIQRDPTRTPKNLKPLLQRLRAMLS